MTFRLALRSLATQPVRSLVLAGGFGMGIASMAGLLGVGEVILEQSRSPVLKGGGDVLVTGSAGPLQNTRFLTTSVLAAPPFAGRVRAASPSLATTLYLVQPGRPGLRVGARGGVPSLERAVGDPEVAGSPDWRDSPTDRAWAAPEPGEVLRAMDRFHPIPDVPDRADSWAEWLYFNGGAGSGTRFYLTFLAGRRSGPDLREAFVRLQLERDGNLTAYSHRAEISERELLDGAPDFRIGRSEVRLEGSHYRIHLELREEREARDDRSLSPETVPELIGDLVLDAGSGGSLPPLRVLGAGGWLSGYTVPVLSGKLEGQLLVSGESVEITGALGYHDHNWGFWEGVTWQWGQVAGDEISLVYGRVRPPADAADPERLPGFLVVLGPNGPLGYAMGVRIDEEEDPRTGHPSSLEVTAVGRNVSLRMTFDVDDATRTPFRSGPAGAKLEFLQMRGQYRVDGVAGGRSVEFTAAGAAETFRTP